MGGVGREGTQVVGGVLDLEEGFEPRVPGGTGHGAAIADHHQARERADAGSGELRTERDGATTVHAHGGAEGVTGEFTGGQVVLGETGSHEQTARSEQVGVEAGAQGLGGLLVGTLGGAQGVSGGAVGRGGGAFDRHDSLVDGVVATSRGDDLGLDRGEVSLEPVEPGIHVGEATTGLGDLGRVGVDHDGELGHVGVDAGDLLAESLFEGRVQLGGDRGDPLLPVAGPAAGLALEVGVLLVRDEVTAVGGLAVRAHDGAAVDEDVGQAVPGLGHEATGDVIDGAVRGALGLLVHERLPGGGASGVLGGDVALPHLLAHGERVQGGGVAVVVVPVVADLGGAGVDERVRVITVHGQRGADREGGGRDRDAVAVAVDVDQATVQPHTGSGDGAGRASDGGGRDQGHEGQHQGGSEHDSSSGFFGIRSHAGVWVGPSSRNAFQNQPSRPDRETMVARLIV